MKLDYNFIFINNPKSSNNMRVRKKIDQLEKTLGHKLKTISSEKELEDFEAKFSKVIQTNKDYIVLIGGGDGTVHQVVQATAKLPKDKRRKIVLFPVWGGNANDFANMLNGVGVNKNLFKIINKAKIVEIHPLKIQVDKKTNYAICYASFGASAYAADVIDKTGPARKGRFNNFPVIIVINEAVSVLRAFLRADPFKASINGKQVEMFEQAFANGSRWAKVYRIPLSITDDKFYKLVQPKKNPAMLVRIFKLLSGKQVGELTNQPTEFKVKEPVLAQYDGEVVEIPANATVKVGLSNKVVRALATKNV